MSLIHVTNLTWKIKIKILIHALMLNGVIL